MPTYEYLCEENGRVLEVSHKMAESVSTWAELCDRAQVPLGTTPAATPVRKLMSAGFVNTGAVAAQGEARACDIGLPCCGGGCGSA